MTWAMHALQCKWEGTRKQLIVDESEETGERSRGKHLQRKTEGHQRGRIKWEEEEKDELYI